MDTTSRPCQTTPNISAGTAVGAAKGSYTYICQIHTGMEATITVH
jgi:hypothetical protein